MQKYSENHTSTVCVALFCFYRMEGNERERYQRRYDIDDEMIARMEGYDKFECWENMRDFLTEKWCEDGVIMKQCQHRDSGSRSFKCAFDSCPGYMIISVVGGEYSITVDVQHTCGGTHEPSADNRRAFLAMLARDEVRYEDGKR